MRALGIDPGLASIGVSVLDWEPGSPAVARSACVINTKPGQNAVKRVTDDDALRVAEISDQINEVIELVKPDVIGAEAYRVFTRKAATSAWKVCYVFGAIVGVAAVHKIPFVSVLPDDIKRRVAQYSKASKEQVEAAVTRQVTGLTELLSTICASKRNHAADAAAIALLALAKHVQVSRSQS